MLTYDELNVTHVLPDIFHCFLTTSDRMELFVAGIYSPGTRSYFESNTFNLFWISNTLNGSSLVPGGFVKTTNPAEYFYACIRQLILTGADLRRSHMPGKAFSIATESLSNLSLHDMVLNAFN